MRVVLYPKALQGLPTGTSLTLLVGQGYARFVNKAKSQVGDEVALCSDAFPNTERVMPEEAPTAVIEGVEAAELLNLLEGMRSVFRKVHPHAIRLQSVMAPLGMREQQDIEITAVTMFDGPREGPFARRSRVRAQAFLPADITGNLCTVLDGFFLIDALCSVGSQVIRLCFFESEGSYPTMEIQSSHGSYLIMPLSLRRTGADGFDY